MGVRSKAHEVKGNEQHAVDIEDKVAGNEQMNLRIRLILQSFNTSLQLGNVISPDPGQK